MNEETWKPVDGYEGVYEVSNHGKVRSLDRIVKQNNNGTTVCMLYPGKELKGRTMGNGYVRVHLSKGGQATEAFVHRLVATAFCDKPLGCSIVNHLDNNPSNNVASNLEWTTFKGNMQWATKQGRMHYQPANLKKAQDSRRRPVVAISKDGTEYHFRSQAEAVRALGLLSIRGHIASCCRGDYGYKTAGGYSWRYAD